MEIGVENAVFVYRYLLPCKYFDFHDTMDRV